MCSCYYGIQLITVDYSESFKFNLVQVMTAMSVQNQLFVEALNKNFHVNPTRQTFLFF